MDDVLKEFLIESWEGLTELDASVVALEERGVQPDLLASIFRIIHTIKGTCGFIGLVNIGRITHSTESVLGLMREGKLEATTQTITLTLRAVDEIKSMLRHLEETGQEPATVNGDTLNTLELLARIPEEFGKTGRMAGPLFYVPEATPEDHLSMGEITEPEAESQPAVRVVPQAATISETPPVPEPTSCEAMTQTATPPAEINNAAVASSEPDDGGNGKRSKVADLSIRVNVNVLDSLMNLVGELVLTRNQLLQLSRGDEESKYAAPITLLNRVTTDLQEGVMKTRMQPIGSVWQSLPRIIRDLRQVTGKQIELDMRGSETELDRTLLEAIRDPLTHMIRNSADHGLELPEIRRQKGKPECGMIRLDAYHEGGHVIISIEDDGAGINVKRVREKAVSQGLISEVDAARLPDHELIQFVFRPGFSTAQQVTSLSGRGVGMDVVKTQIEKIGGTVDLSSTLDKGATVRIKIPLTLAIISALVVESGGQSFAIPQLGIVELVRLAAEERHRIEKIHNNEVFRLRHRLLPLIRLDGVVQLPTRMTAESDVNIVVLQVGDQQFGLIVDRVFDTEEIVVKPVGSLLKDIPIYQGTTILGDGRVIMILDVAGIASEIGLSTMTSDIAEQNDRNADGETTNLLCFNAGDGRAMSVPLSLVSRLEEVPREKIETTGDREVVQYRGDLLPLVPVHGYSRHSNDKPIQPVIVFQENGRAMGLMVSEIEDIVEDRLVIRMASQQPGVVGTAIVNNRATEIVDAHHYVIQANPEWFHHNHWRPNWRILLVEDSVFFRQLLTTNLESEGYSVTAVVDGKQGIATLERDANFDLIVSDIEMPEVDGLSFARWVRSKSQFQDKPMIAMSGNTRPSMDQDAIKAGFTKFMRKFDPAELKAVLFEMCSAQKRRGVSA